MGPVLLVRCLLVEAVKPVSGAAFSFVATKRPEVFGRFELRLALECLAVAPIRLAMRLHRCLNRGHAFHCRREAISEEFGNLA